MKNQFNEHFLDNIDCQEKAYYLGLMYSDGCVSKVGNSYRIQFSQSENRKDLVYKIKELLNSESNIHIINIPNGKPQYEICVSSSHFGNMLVNYGCVPNKSTVLTYPDFLSDELIPHFIRGIFDGDGCI